MIERKVTILLDDNEHIADEGIALLNEQKYNVVFPENARLILTDSNYRSSEALLIRGATVNKEIIENMPNLKVIARSGSGYDNIDIETATNQGVYVCNVPDANFTSVAELVIGMIISLSHQILIGDRSIRKGEFDIMRQHPGKELSGKTIGVIGFGRIGQLVAKKCVHGLDMNVLAYDPYVNETNLESVRLVETTDEVFEKADFITLHLPYIPSLHHFINEDVLKKTKNTAYIINCARGGLIDENSLIKAIKNNEIAGAGLDVFQHEPLEKDNSLLHLNNVVVTPHIGASTYEALTQMAEGAAKEIIRVFEGRIPHNALNKI